MTGRLGVNLFVPLMHSLFLFLSSFFSLLTSIYIFSLHLSKVAIWNQKLKKNINGKGNILFGIYPFLSFTLHPCTDNVSHSHRFVISIHTPIFFPFYDFFPSIHHFLVISISIVAYE